MGQRPEPIRSELALDPDMEERIDAFIFGLGERIDMIQEADRAGDLKTGARRLRELAREAGEVGFPQLEEAARAAARCGEDGDAARTHERIVAVTEMVQRVRLGHRGAL